MLTKKELQFVNSLKQKKHREEHGLFIAEGTKIVEELLASEVEVQQVFATQSFLEKNAINRHIAVTEVKEAELERLSALTTPNETLAVCCIPKHTFDKATLNGKLTLVLDNIRDPGNLGTIIRIADWFGIDTIICSPETVDVYNPKVVQATMGSIARIKLHYMQLPLLFEELKAVSETCPMLHVYGALLEGDTLYSKNVLNEGLIVIGNESKGISEQVLPYITDKISIPSFSHYKSVSGEAESLNAAIATAIICSEFRRKDS